MNLLDNDQEYEEPTTYSEPVAGMWMKRLREYHPPTYAHSARVALLAERMVPLLDTEHGIEIVSGCFLHDLGKMKIPLDILDNPGKLNSEEWRQIKGHPMIGYQLLQYAGLEGTVPSYVLHHHERWDGNGYPHGLSREEIPLGARVCSVVDALDCMLTYRPYRKSVSVQEALEELRRHAGTQFDERIVQVACDMSRELHLMYDYQQNNLEGLSY